MKQQYPQRHGLLMNDEEVQACSALNKELCGQNNKPEDNATGKYSIDFRETGTDIWHTKIIAGNLEAVKPLIDCLAQGRDIRIVDNETHEVVATWPGAPDLHRDHRM